jgi:alpha,alpha-trehalose-phosphate synthase [UDP-forming]
MGGGLVVVSNRLPCDIGREPGRGAPRRNVGGLVNAIEPVLAERGGLWVGWDGATLPSAAAVAHSRAAPRSARLPSGVVLCGVPLSERDIARYYHGASNRALWPLFHDFPGKTVFEPEDWVAYREVNRRFAEAALRHAREGDRIWVHDFHLLLVPRQLRELGFRGRVDFFLHIPFPPAEIFRVLPWREEVLEGLLAAHTVVFQVARYRRNFVDSVRSIAVPGATDAAARAFAEPIGIDAADFVRLADDPGVRARAAQLRRAYGSRPILFGGERLDYTKGILERFHAVERLLKTAPSRAGSFAFVQVVVPGRHQVEEYRQMKREIEREVGRINGEWGAEGWVPIHYRARALDRPELVAHYLAASVVLVTPLRDGMNLVAPEFVAARRDGDGVLVLSEFAGVAEHLPGALQVNPNDLETFAATLARALAMGEPERRRRMEAMRPFVEANPATAWAERCLALPAGAPVLSERAG